MDRMVLAKNVLNSFRNYVMSSFKLLKGNIDWLDRIMISFIWAGENDSCSIHWKSKDMLFLRCSACMNQAFLAKLAWKLIHKPKLLFSRFFGAKYYKRQDFLKRKPRSTDYWVWKSILWGRDILKPSLKWWVITDHQVKIHEKWILEVQTLCLPLYRSPPVLISWYRTLSLRIVLGDFRYCISSFPFDILHRITAIFLPKYPTLLLDNRYWPHSPNGSYTVKTGYRLADQTRRQNLPCFLISQQDRP